VTSIAPSGRGSIDRDQGRQGGGAAADAGGEADAGGAADSIDGGGAGGDSDGGNEGRAGTRRRSLGDQT